jgi:hypothetical protein
MYINDRKHCHGPKSLIKTGFAIATALAAACPSLPPDLERVIRDPLDCPPDPHVEHDTEKTNENDCSKH